MSEYVIAAESDLEEGDRMVVQLEGREIVVFNVDGEYYSYTNWCAHQGGPACEGLLTGTTTAEFDRESLNTEVEWSRDGEILTCPWHAWEFDVKTGECLSRQKVRLIKHQVTVEDGDVTVTL